MNHRFINIGLYPTVIALITAPKHEDLFSCYPVGFALITEPNLKDAFSRSLEAISS